MIRDEAFCDAPYDTAESCAEQSAAHQKALDVLYLIGHAYDVRVDHMRELCSVAGVSFDEFCKYIGEHHEHCLHDFGPVRNWQNHQPAELKS